MKIFQSEGLKVEGNLLEFSFDEGSCMIDEITFFLEEECIDGDFNLVFFNRESSIYHFIANFKFSIGKCFRFSKNIYKCSSLKIGISGENLENLKVKKASVSYTPENIVYRLKKNIKYFSV